MCYILNHSNNVLNQSKKYSVARKQVQTPYEIYNFVKMNTYYSIVKLDDISCQ